MQESAISCWMPMWPDCRSACRYCSEGQAPDTENGAHVATLRCNTRNPSRIYTGGVRKPDL